jgi:DNA-binding NarL/FixJ family response regulator
MGIVALTVFNLPEHIIACMESGASSHVDKAAPIEELIEAIKRSAAAPHNFSARKITEAISAKNRVVGLTPREIEILEILPTGDTVTQIAARLFISVSTTKTHLASIYRKLGAVNRVQAINAARRAGLLHQ